MIIERTHLACTTDQMRPRMLIDASRPLSLSALTCSVADVCFVHKRYTTSIDCMICTYSWKCTEAYIAHISQIWEKDTRIIIILRQFIICYNEVLSLYIAWFYEVYTYLYTNEKFGMLYYVACLNRNMASLIFSEFV